jgi:2-C-methyl-D-erythritol 4-phosphate cytidylyltransferase
LKNPSPPRTQRQSPQRKFFEFPAVDFLGELGVLGGNRFELSHCPLVYLHPAMKVIVIIPAAGLGTRMAPMPSALDAKTKKPHPSKQFTELAGTPILIHTLRKFAAVEAVTEIWIALRENEIEGFRERLRKEAKAGLKKKVELVAGGEHRQQSVEQALNAVSAAPDDVILVHDAVRPLVTAEVIDEVIQAAKKYGAAIAALPAVDTVKQVERTAEGAIVKATIPRAGVVLAQTPQGFHYSVIKKAFDEAAADGFMGTDEASLAERSGHEVAVVMGSPRNIKITTPADMELAEFYLKK